MKLNNNRVVPTGTVIYIPEFISTGCSSITFLEVIMDEDCEGLICIYVLLSHADLDVKPYRMWQ
jgi:hypothetical protein